MAGDRQLALSGLRHRTYWKIHLSRQNSLARSTSTPLSVSHPPALPSLSVAPASLSPANDIESSPLQLLKSHHNLHTAYKIRHKTLHLRFDSKHPIHLKQLPTPANSSTKKRQNQLQKATAEAKAARTIFRLYCEITGYCLLSSVTAIPAVVFIIGANNSYHDPLNFFSKSGNKRSRRIFADMTGSSHTRSSCRRLIAADIVRKRASEESLS